MRNDLAELESTFKRSPIYLIEQIDQSHYVRRVRFSFDIGRRFVRHLFRSHNASLSLLGSALRDR